MKVLALDAALGNTGVAVVEDGKVIYLGKIVTSIKKATPDESARIKEIHQEVAKLIMYHNPDVVICENQHVNKLNPQTSLSLARVRGAIQLTCALMSVPFYTIEPNQIKKAVTGKGNAKKDQVQQSIVMKYPDQPLVQSKLGKIIATGQKKTDDIADALAIAYTYSSDPNIAVTA